jgi:hypothetical protein
VLITTVDTHSYSVTGREKTTPIEKTLGKHQGKKIGGGGSEKRKKEEHLFWCFLSAPLFPGASLG